MSTQKLTVGTAHFVTLTAADNYYGTRETVKAKLDAGEIVIGPPVIDTTKERLLIDKEERRYFIQDI